MVFKENDIRPADLMELKKPALEHDKNYLKERIPLFVKSNCVACGSLEVKFWAEKEKFTYDQCSDCNTIYMNPRPTESVLGDFYKQSQNYDFWNKYIFPTTDAVRKEKIFKPRADKTVQFCEKYGVKGGTLLEIGSAFGTYCEAVREKDFFERIVAVEPTPGLAQTCRNKNIETFEQTIEELSFLKESADVVANFEVIEHLGNPKLFIQKSVEYLKKGGLFICTCPNGEGLGTLVLKEQAKVVDHEHVNYFNPKSLSLLLDICGLETLEVTTPGELDVDLLFNDYKQCPDLFEDKQFFKHLFDKKDEKLLSNFQIFIKENQLSSHLWIIAKKK